METPDRRAGISDLKSLLLKSLFCGVFPDLPTGRITSLKADFGAKVLKTGCKVRVFSPIIQIYLQLFNSSRQLTPSKDAKRYLRLAK